MRRFSYKAHNLIVSSELELPEMTPGSGDTDVTVSFGKVPEEIASAIIKKRFYQLTATEYLLNASGVARFYVKNGTSITIEKDEEASSVELRIYLLHRIWGILLAQRKQYALHACAVLFNERSYLFTGSIMSTALLGNYFREQGITVLSDSISLTISEHQKTPLIVQGFQNIRYDTVMPSGISNPLFSPTQLQKIFYLETSEVSHFTSESMGKTDVFRVLLKNVFQILILKEMGLDKEAFEYFIKLAGNVEMIKITMPISNFSLSEFKNYIERLI